MVPLEIKKGRMVIEVRNSGWVNSRLYITEWKINKLEHISEKCSQNAA